MNDVSFDWDMLMFPPAAFPPPLSPNITIEGMTTWGHERIQVVLTLFPELDGVPIRFRYSSKLKCAYALHSRGLITFSVPEPPYQTIGHEIMHEVQCQRLGVPYGERSCDLYTIARACMLSDQMPYYLRTPFDGHVYLFMELRYEAFKLAREAIAKRSGGLRNYISWWEDRMVEIAKEKYPALASEIVAREPRNIDVPKMSDKTQGETQ